MHLIFKQKFLYTPVITWGKYIEKNGKITLPFSFNIHHAAADGYHLSRFFIELQELLNSFEN